MKFKALLYQNPSGFISVLVVLLFVIISFFVDDLLFNAFAVAFGIIFCLNILYSFSSLRNTGRYVEALGKALSSRDYDNIASLPLPAFICNKAGNVVWYNEMFREAIIEACNLKSLSAYDFFDDFSFGEFSDKRFFSAEFADRRFTVFTANADEAGNSLICFYLFDDTQLKELKEEYEFSRPFVMLMLVDNIEQLSRQLTDSKFALVSSGIESRIEEWLKDEPVVLKKIGNGSYLVIGEQRNLYNLSENKFSVLNHIREFEYNGTLVNSTLSIGVGTGVDFAECELKARKALDMSLGRGGDQAAIFTEEGYIYFGGVSNRTNDNSRVSPRQTAANISTLIKKFKQVIIVGHKYSDYDAIGSAMGLQFFSEANGVKAYVVVDPKTTLASPLVSYATEKDYNPFITPAKALDFCDDDTVVIVVDTHRQQLLDSPDLYSVAGDTIVIDHHRRSDDYIDDANIFYCSPQASSTCELVSELIEYSLLIDRVPSVIATALLSGIVLDTKDYVLRTSQRTFEAAGFLRDNGADTVTVKKLFSVDTETAMVKQEIIADAAVFDGFMIGSTTSDSKNIRIITSVSADEMLNIDGVKAAFVISKISLGKYQISARSLGEENVQLIMERLGGGGHNTMAAAQIKANGIEQAKQHLLDAIDGYIENK